MNNEEFFRWCTAATETGGVAWFGRHVLVDGEPIHCIEQGSGEPLLLLHGFLEWSYTWRRNLAFLAGRYRVIAPDLRGYGLSARESSRGHSLTDQARLVRRLMASVGVDHAVLCGHSMGGEIALRLAVDCPQAVRALVLVDASAYLRIEQHPARRLATRLPGLSSLAIRAVARDRRFVARALRQALYSPDLITEADIDAYVLPVRVPRAAATLVRILQDADFGAYAGRWSQVKCPTLLIWGENDPVVPLAQGERLARELPDSRLAVLPHCGHHPHVEYPDQFHEVLLAFLEQLER